jgi:hypothetical protein
MPNTQAHCCGAHVGGSGAPGSAWRRRSSLSGAGSLLARGLFNTQLSVNVNVMH